MSNLIFTSSIEDLNNRNEFYFQIKAESMDFLKISNNQSTKFKLKLDQTP